MIITFGLEATSWFREWTGGTAEVVAGYCASLPADLLSILCSEGAAKNVNVLSTRSILSFANFFAVYGANRHALVKKIRSEGARRNATSSRTKHLPQYCIEMRMCIVADGCAILQVQVLKERFCFDSHSKVVSSSL